MASKKKSLSMAGKFDDASGFTVPSIFEDDESGRRMGYDIFSRLLKDGIVTLNGAVSDQTAALVTAQLLWLDRNYTPKSKDDMITFYINSPGGSVTAGMAIYDTMMRMKNPVRTVCTGHAASMGSFLLMAGYPGERYAMPNSQIMIHEVSAGTQGKASDMDNMTDVFNTVNDRLIKSYVFHTGLDESKLRLLMEGTDTFMNGEEAAALNLIDHVAYDAFDSKDEFKQKWAKFVEDLNKDQAQKRGTPRTPVNDVNIMDLAKRKTPKGPK